MSIETMKAIGERLRVVREKKHLTQRQVATRAGLHPNRYAVIERGEAKNMNINSLEKIVKILDVKSKDILPF